MQNHRRSRWFWGTQGGVSDRACNADAGASPGVHSACVTPTSGTGRCALVPHVAWLCDVHSPALAKPNSRSVCSLCSSTCRAQCRLNPRLDSGCQSRLVAACTCCTRCVCLPTSSCVEPKVAIVSSHACVCLCVVCTSFMLFVGPVRHGEGEEAGATPRRRPAPPPVEHTGRALAPTSVHSCHRRNDWLCLELLHKW